MEYGNIHMEKAQVQSGSCHSLSLLIQRQQLPFCLKLPALGLLVTAVSLHSHRWKHRSGRHRALLLSLKPHSYVLGKEWGHMLHSRKWVTPICALPVDGPIPPHSGALSHYLLPCPVFVHSHNSFLQQNGLRST